MITKPIPVILDTDMGTDIDDTWALCMLLGCPELDLKMVVTEHGDTAYRAALAAKYLEICDRTDVPVGIGVADLEDKVPKHQAPWVEDYDLNAYPGTVYQDGVQAMVDYIMAAEEPITIIAIGVVTNLAKALEIEPRIAQKCKFVGMHGSVRLGYGGSKEISAEANVINDVPAFRKVIAADWLDKLITPVDTCGLIVLDDDRYQQVYHAALPRVKALMENYKIWASLVNWVDVDYFEARSSVLYDTVAIYLAYDEALCEIEEVSISTNDEGFTLIDPDGAKVRAALAWKDLDAFYDHLTARLLAE